MGNITLYLIRGKKMTVIFLPRIRYKVKSTLNGMADVLDLAPRNRQRRNDSTRVVNRRPRFNVQLWSLHKRAPVLSFYQNLAPCS